MHCGLVYESVHSLARGYMIRVWLASGGLRLCSAAPMNLHSNSLPMEYLL